MEKFCKHIEKLLAQYDYVVVPNLGGFIVQVQSAQILPNRIIPPLATIAFNPLLHHADGLLAIEISRTEQISYRQAMEYIDNHIDGIKSKLDSGTQVEFGNLGIFYQNEGGSLTFSPLDKADFLPGNFQLADLHLSTKKFRLPESKKTITFTLPSSSTYKYAAAAMLIFGLFISTPKVNDAGRASADLTSFSFKNIKKNDIVSTPKIKKIENIVKDSIATKPTEIEPNFHVIIASLPTEESAERFCKGLSTKEFPNVHILSRAKTYRIAIQSFQDREEAIKFMEELRQTDSRFESSWVLCNQ